MFSWRREQLSGIGFLAKKQIYGELSKEGRIGFVIKEDQFRPVGGNCKDTDFGHLKKNHIEVCLQWRGLSLVLGGVHEEAGLLDTSPYVERIPRLDGLDTSLPNSMILKVIILTTQPSSRFAV